VVAETNLHVAGEAHLVGVEHAGRGRAEVDGAGAGAQPDDDLAGDELTAVGGRASERARDDAHARVGVRAPRRFADRAQDVVRDGDLAGAADRPSLLREAELVLGPAVLEGRIALRRSALEAPVPARAVAGAGVAGGPAAELGARAGELVSEG